MNKTSDIKYVDLHVHTTFSDGMFTPEEVVEKALERGLKAVGITDHDCIGGIQPCIDAAKGTSLEIIPGVEITASRDEETELHILGYLFDYTDPELLAILNKIENNRVQRIKDMVALLNEQGLDIREEQVFSGSADGTIGRPHLARVLVEEKKVKTLNEAFNRYIGDTKPCYVKHKRIDYRDAIKAIRAAGGVPVLAHPGSNDRDEHIPDYIAAGLRGIEVFHTKHKDHVSNKYLVMAQKSGLVITGGSDCHGAKKGEVLMGKVKVGYEIVEALRAESEKIRKTQ